MQTITGGLHTSPPPGATYLSPVFRAAVAAEPGLRSYLDQELRGEQARRIAWERDDRRYSGVAPAGLRPDPFQKTADEEIVQAALRKKMRHDAWAASPDGRLVHHFVLVEELLAALQHTAMQARAARDRGLASPANLQALMARLDEMAAAAARLSTSLTGAAEAAHRAADEASAAPLKAAG